jgi:hypothetical protein
MVVLRVLFVTENLKVADELQYKKTFLGLDDLEEDVLQTSFGKTLFLASLKLREKREQNFVSTFHNLVKKK